MTSFEQMSDEEARQQVERTDNFIAAFRELIASTVVDPASPCEAASYRGLERIGATVDAGRLHHLRQPRKHQRGHARRAYVGEGSAPNARRRRPYIGLSGRDGILSRVPAGDRCGIEAAPAIRGHR